jgi:hypothetical protein
MSFTVYVDEHVFQVPKVAPIELTFSALVP